MNNYSKLMNDIDFMLEIEVTLGSCHEPYAGLLDVGKVVVCMAGEVVGLRIQRVVGCLPLHFEVERSVGSIGLALVCLDVLEFAITVLEGEVRLCGDLLADAMAQGTDKLVTQEGQS